MGQCTCLGFGQWHVQLCCASMWRLEFGNKACRERNLLKTCMSKFPVVVVNVCNLVSMQCITVTVRTTRPD